MALHANQKTAQALEMLSNAISIDPKNPLARFQKAQVLPCHPSPSLTFPHHPSPSLSL